MKKIKKIGIIFMVFLTMFLLVSCSSKETVKEDPGSLNENPLTKGIDIKTTESVDYEPKDITKETVPVKEEETTPKVILPAEPVQKSNTNLDSEILELVEKTNDIDNYEYYYKSVIRNEYGSSVTDESYQLYYNGGLMKKVYNDAKFLADEFRYNEVYLNSDDNKALIVCTLTSVSCEDYLKQGYSIFAAPELPEVTPLIIIENIPTSAEETGEVTIDGRKVMIIEYEIGNDEYETVYLDTYYGLPLKKEIYTYDVDEKIVLETKTFSKIVVDGVKLSEVTFPEEFEVIN